METWDAIAARRNVREFEARPIPEEDLRRVLEAGRRSPSAKNWQPWDFVVVTDTAQLEELSAVWKGAWHVAGAAAAICLVLPTGLEPAKRLVAEFDLGQACAAMQIVAADLGIGSGHANAKDQALAQDVLGLPKDRELVRIIDLGYPQDRSLGPAVKLDRRDFDDVVHRGRW